MHSKCLEIYSYLYSYCACDEDDRIFLYHNLISLIDYAPDVVEEIEYALFNCLLQSLIQQCGRRGQRGEGEASFHRSILLTLQQSAPYISTQLDNPHTKLLICFLFLFSI